MHERVLVTGADGFIGSHLVETLVRQGVSVKAFVMYNSFNSWGWLDDISPEVSGHFEVVSGDIRDFICVKTAMSGCDAVAHLAALIAIPYSYIAPSSYIETNVTGSLNVFQSARELGLSRVLHTSTSEVYGTARFVPITEDHPLNAQSPYAATKVAADQMALSYCTSFDLPLVIARPFNTYGPRQSARAVIPSIITQLGSGVEVLKLGATSPTRDFNFVGDTVAGMTRLLRSTDGVGEVFNLGSNFEVSIRDTAATIADLMGVEVEIACDHERLRPKKSEVERLLASNHKIKNIFGWEPQFAGIDGFRRGLGETISWFNDQSNLLKYKTNAYNI